MSAGAMNVIAAVLERSGECMAVVDPDGYVLAANQRLLDLCGYAGGAARGAHVSELIPGPWGGAVSVAGNEPWKTGRVGLVRRQGVSVPATAQITPVEDTDGELVGFVVVVDAGLRRGASGTTDSRSDDERLRLLEHRLRNAMTVVATNIDLVERAADSGQRKRLALIRSALAAGLEALEAIHGHPRAGPASRPHDADERILRAATPPGRDPGA